MQSLGIPPAQLTSGPPMTLKLLDLEKAMASATAATYWAGEFRDISAFYQSLSNYIPATHISSPAHSQMLGQSEVSVGAMTDVQVFGVRVLAFSWLLLAYVSTEPSPL